MCMRKHIKRGTCRVYLVEKDNCCCVSLITTMSIRNALTLPASPSLLIKSEWKTKKNLSLINKKKQLVDIFVF